MLRQRLFRRSLHPSPATNSPPRDPSRPFGEPLRRFSAVGARRPLALLAGKLARLAGIKGFSAASKAEETPLLHSTLCPTVQMRPMSTSMPDRDRPPRRPESWLIACARDHRKR